MLYLTYMSTIDRFLNHAIKVLLVCITCIMLIIGLLFVTPVYVHAESSDILIVPYFTSKPTTGELGSSGVLVNDTYLGCYYSTSPLSDTTVYAFAYTGGGANPHICFVRDNTGDNSANLKGLYDASRYVTSNPSGSPSTANINTLNSTYNLYYSSFQGGTYDNTTSIFTDLDSGLAAVRDYIDNPIPDGPIDLGPKEFDIPAGYAYYILTNGGSATLTTKFTVYNNLFTGGWSVANQRIGISETRVPSSGYTFGSNTGSVIPWHKLGTADSNILGQTYYGQYIYTNCPDNGNYLVIYNPVYAYDDDVTSNVNGTIHVEISNFVGANRFALRSSLGFNGSVDSVSPDDYTDFQSTGTGDLVVGDGSSLTWYDATRSSEDIDSSTGSAAPAPSAPYNDTSSVPDNNTFLGNLVERIVSFLEAPISHIKSLQDAASNFMGWLANLWKWLPETVVVVIVDALIVLIVIGVVKFLWK